AGATLVLHTHTRALDYHPHVHLLMPAAAVDTSRRLWREKQSRGKKHYLFNHRALAKVFRAKMLAAITEAGLLLPEQHPTTWVVDCKAVGRGRKALVYLGRYLYRGVIQEKDVIACTDGKVTYRYQDSKTKKMVYKTVSGETFLWLLMQHVLPKGFRRARNFGFLHPNSKRLIQLVQYLLNLRPISVSEIQIKRPRLRCKCCGSVMQILATQIFPSGRYKVKDGVEPLAM
ncbi:MAG: transposase, partial [gamma proteobacterium endosymbiont of Lamellibrachia anaximandri]|nr:transposase [gamma proteobacterium endosymbiont of Lamellibrachia anaximandri]